MRIWLNRGFSIRQIAGHMLKADEDLQLALHPDQIPEGHAERVLAVNEQDEDPEKLADAIADIVHDHSIDAIAAQRNIQHMRYAGCPVHAPANLETLTLLDDKLEFSKRILQDEYYAKTIDAGTPHEFQEKASHLMGKGMEICVKPRRGVNGHGYWRIVSGDPIDLLNMPEKHEIPLAVYTEALKQSAMHGRRHEIVIMEYLPGPEVSVDMLAWHGDPLAGVARIKTGDFEQHVVTRHPVMDHAKMMVADFCLHGPVGIQYRRHRDGSWKILEINARAAGGIIYSEACGGELIRNWTRLLTGRSQTWQIQQPEIDQRIAINTVIAKI